MYNIKVINNIYASIIILFFLFISSPSMRVSAQVISETKYDYSIFAHEITSNSTTQKEQAEAIYKWICRNVAYDINHEIHTADECFNQRKGVCQAYCELFCRLAEPLGIKCSIVPGVTKDSKGCISEKGHAWLLVEIEDKSILVDPTWGAGGVKDGVFIASDNDMSWFDVNPYWMIFTHHPDDSTNQFIDIPIDRETFSSLPHIKPILETYGLNGKDFYKKYLRGEIASLPYIYSAHAHDFFIKDIPLQEELVPGQHYTFKLDKRTDSIMALAHDGEFLYDNMWQIDDGCYTISYMPTAAGPLRIVVACGEGNYSTAIEYKVIEPTAEGIEQIEQDNPYRLPEVKQVANLYPERMDALGISGNKVLYEVRVNGLKAIFLQHQDATIRLDKVDVPLSQYLDVGQTYRFSILPTDDTVWAIFNEGHFYNTWEVDESTGWRTIEVCPMNKGRLTVSMGLPPEMQKYSAMLIYVVR